MSSDASMSSDDQPLRSQSRSAGHPRSRSPFINGKRRAKGDQADQSMSDDEETPLAGRKSETEVPACRPPKRKKVVYAESSSEEETPLASSPGKKPASRTNSRSRKVMMQDSNDVISPEEPKRKSFVNGRCKPVKKKAKEESPLEESRDHVKPQKRRPASTPSKANVEPESEEDTIPPKPTSERTTAKRIKEEENADPPKVKKTRVEKEKEQNKASGKMKTKKEAKEEEIEIYRWWDANANGDDSVKWTTLEHNGVIFPPPYEPLPSHVKMKYNGWEVDLPPAAEEVAVFYGALIETDHARDATFNKNFFEDWKNLMKKHPPRDGTKIISFELCDFRPIFEHLEAEKAKKKAMTADEKKAAKKAKDEAEAKYTHCLLDGRREKIGNFRVEPPGLFRGRGDHPKKGCIKNRVRPEDITLNIGEGAPIPVPNFPGKWNNVIHDNTVTWLANWTENVNGNHKYVFLAAGSSLKGQSDWMKFEKARELKQHVDRIRQNYNMDLRSKVMADRQRATTMYFIDKLALRAGNEKGEDEADTVGCCSLRCEHVTLQAPDTIIFDFLGKDSIRYYNTVHVEPQIFKNIRIFKENKNDDDSLFDRVTTSSLNKHLNSEMQGLTAKVFRTFNASKTFQELLDKDTLEGTSLQEKLNAYNSANRNVAILCNHQRTAPKTHEQSMEKMHHKCRVLKYERMKLRHALLTMDNEIGTVDDDSDLDDAWIAKHEDDCRAKEIEKAEKKFLKDNEKLVEQGKASQPGSVLEKRKDEIEAEYDVIIEERGTGKASLKRKMPIDKMEEAVDKLTGKIKAYKLQIVDKDAGKEVALGTSKINYLDPRITAAWCKVHDVPIEKIFSKTLITKFPWAMEADPDWKF